MRGANRTSHQKAAKAAADGMFDDEIVPIGDVKVDGTIRPDSNVEKLATLKPAFLEDGSVTAATSSPLTDGSAAVLVASEDYASKNGLPVLARIKSVAVSGCAAEIMGIGPVPATQKALERAGVKLDDIDIFSAMKAWQYADDFILSELCKMILDRKLLHIKIKNAPFKPEKFKERFLKTQKKFNLTDEEASYFVFDGMVENKAYNRHHQNINILKKNGKIVDVAKLSDHLNLNALSKTVIKYYICYPKDAV